MSQLIKKIRTDAGDLQIDYNALANLPTISNPNLLINSDFRNPVNQRGETTYKSTAGNFTRVFTIDRWNMQNGTTLTVNTASISLKGDSTASGTCIFSQVLEYCPQGNYTLQVKVLSSVNGSEICIMNSSSNTVLTQPLYVGVNQFTVTDTDIKIVQIYLASDSEIELEWIKLESGTTATPFVSRLFAEELMLCQRYYQRVSGYRFPMMMTTANALSGEIPLGITMRATPTVAIVDFSYLDYSQGAYVKAAEVSPDTSYTINKVVVIQITKNSASTMVKGDSAHGVIHAQFDAEIY